MESIKIIETFSVLPGKLYTSWLNSEEHSDFTGGEAEIYPIVGSKYSAWDNYISGTILELEPNKRVLMSWRTEEFEETDADSFLEIIFESKNGATLFILNHSNIPDGEGKKYEDGWKEHYITPMKKHFEKR